jgi:hypothetical protein
MRIQSRYEGIPPDRQTGRDQYSRNRTISLTALNAYAVLDQPGGTDKQAAKSGSLKPHRENALVHSIQTSGIQGAHCAKYSGQRASQPEGNVIKNAVFALAPVPLLTMPAFAATLNVGDKPIVVAEGADVRIGGVGAGVGERHRHRGLGLYL